MYLHEDLYIKILDDFHSEINPVIKEIDLGAIDNYWYDKKISEANFLY